MRRWIASTLVIVIVAPAAAAAAQPPAPTYWQDIRPVFRKHCTVCHSARNVAELDLSGGLALDSYAATMKGSRQAVVRSGPAEDSLLFRLLVTDNVKRRMPLDAPPLPKETIDLIRRWIEAGAKEGERIEAAVEPTATATSAPARKLDVVFPTAAVPPAELLGKTPPGKLEVVLKIGPLAPVAAVAFSPEGRLLAAGSYGQVAIWDLEVGRPVRLLRNVLGAVHDVKFSPDGKTLAVAGGQPAGKGEVRLFSPDDGKLRGVLRGHDDVVFAAAFSPDGARLATASFDHTLALWHVADLTKIRDFKVHSDFVYAIAFAPDGKHVVSASKDRTVQMTELATGKSIFTFSGMEQDVLAVAISPDGKSVVSSGFEAGIYWWNPQTGERVRVQGGHGVAVHELVFSKDGKKLVSAGADRTVRTWDGASGAPGKVMNVGSVAYAAAISPNHKLIAVGCFDGAARVFDEASGRLLATLVALPGSGDAVDWLAVTPEGHATASDALVSLSRLRVGGREVAGPALWPALRSGAAVARALRGESVEAVKFAK
ncbi:MAG: hypothetical protein NZO58_04490 [Gemmataceae bacterium]|nr:hypothetical protein [Gemmataceae bacterium]